MELNYKVFGQGDPIVILHGLFGTLDNWQSIARQLSEHHTVYTVDQRNHGKSPHSDTMGYPEMAEDLKFFLESHWIHHSHIIGHSMGGKTAMQFALDFPEMVDRLIIVDISPKRYPGGHQEIFEALNALDLDKIDNRQEADELLKNKIKDFSIRQFLLKNLNRTKEGNYQWKMNLPVLFQYYEDILAPISSDHVYEEATLFIRGGESGYIKDDDLPDIYEYFPEAKVETIPGAGHWVHSQAPEAFVDTVIHFLNI